MFFYFLLSQAEFFDIFFVETADRMDKIVKGKMRWIEIDFEKEKMIEVYWGALDVEREGEGGGGKRGGKGRVTGSEKEVVGGGNERKVK